jgi:DNA-binding CsgD family transcriptional regulator/GAF domain-containing protein
MDPSSGVLQLDVAANDFYSDLRLTPFLRRLLVHSRDLIGGLAGSVSLVDNEHQRYTKVAEYGATCQLGQSFPLDEGITGQAVARRAPVVLGRYSDLQHGHLPTGHPAEASSVVAIPIWWRADVIGVNVRFAHGKRDFTAREVDELEMLTQLAAAGIVRAGTGDPSLSHLIRERAGVGIEMPGLRTIVTEVGQSRALSPTVAQVALDLVSLAQLGASRRQPDARLHVAVVNHEKGLRLLVHDLGAELDDRSQPYAEETSAGWRELADTAGGGIRVEHVPGWGTLLRADLPYQQEIDTPTAAAPFTPREYDVLQLLATGVSDKEVAATLVISTKTVEKHVGALLRKTGANSRTAAVVHALDRGWLPRHPVALTN